MSTLKKNLSENVFNKKTEASLFSSIKLYIFYL